MGTGNVADLARIDPKAVADLDAALARVSSKYGVAPGGIAVHTDWAFEKLRNKGVVTTHAAILKVMDQAMPQRVLNVDYVELMDLYVAQRTRRSDAEILPMLQAAVRATAPPAVGRRGGSASW
jgi:hypothetical protein